MFNALRYTEELEKAGFSRDQAEVSMKVLIDVMNENFATKSDMKELELKLDSSVVRLESKIDSTVQKFESAIREMEYKITIKLGAMLTLAIGVTATIVKLIQSGS
jgi:hypothetical protein